MLAAVWPGSVLVAPLVVTGLSVVMVVVASLLCQTLAVCLQAVVLSVTLCPDLLLLSLHWLQPVGPWTSVMSYALASPVYKKRKFSIMPDKIPKINTTGFSYMVGVK